MTCIWRIHGSKPYIVRWSLVYNTSVFCFSHFHLEGVDGWSEPNETNFIWKKTHILRRSLKPIEISQSEWWDSRYDNVTLIPCVFQKRTEGYVIVSCETGAQVVNKNHGDTFPRENTRWEEEEIVLCVQVLTTCSGKQWWCPNCKVGLSVCIEAPVTIGWS